MFINEQGSGAIAIAIDTTKTIDNTRIIEAIFFLTHGLKTEK